MTAIQTRKLSTLNPIIIDGKEDAVLQGNIFGVLYRQRRGIELSASLAALFAGSMGVFGIEKLRSVELELSPALVKVAASISAWFVDKVPRKPKQSH